MNDHSKRKQNGFTLIEVMITAAIVGILSMIAYPSYLSYVQKGKRATAQAGLMELASKEQTYLLDRRAYTATLTDLSFTTPQSVANDYTYSVIVDNVATPPTFTATAKPVSTAQKANGELDLTLNSVGVKTPTAYWK
jgi:type IV pilus assembly protein PilE